MKRVVTGIVVLCLLALAPIATAATTAGSKCTKAGATSVVKGVKLVCTKSGKILIWTKATVPVAIPTAAPTTKDPLDVLLLPASPTAGSSCKTNGDEQFAAVGPIRCVNNKWSLVAVADDSVMTRSFRYIWQRWQSVKGDPVSSEIVIDPKTGSWKTWAVIGYEGGARYWRATKEKMVVRAIVGPDGNWMDAKAKELGWLTGETFRNALTTRPWDSQNLNRGTPENVNYSLPWANLLLEGPPHPGLNTGISHEFGHAAQVYFSNDKFFRTPNRVPWLDEGMPSLIGAALSPLLGMRYNTRDEWIDRMVRLDIKLRDVSSISLTQGNSELFFRAYAAGFFASEALISLYGAECLDNLYRGISTGGSWNDSFIKEFGIGITEVSDALDAYVQSMRAKKPLTLKELSDQLKRAGATTPSTGWVN